MNDDQIIEYLRSRSRAQPPADLIAHVMDAVDRVPQRRSWLASFVPALAAAGAVAVILALAVLVGQDGPPTGSSGSPTPELSASPVPSALATTEPSGEPFGASVFDDPDSCEDDSVGYRVAYPDSWWWNEPFESEIGPHANCRYFAPEFFDAATVSREQPIPEGVAIFVSVISPDGGLGQLGDVVSSEELTVAGQPATREEQEFAPGGFLAPDERVYRYVIELSDDRRLVVSAGNRVGDYEENQQVLDGMMETLELFDPDDICGPDGDRFACGQIIVGLADGTGEPIETVVERNGGEPTTDIVERLDETGAYVVSVPHGAEGDEVSRYLLDESVGYAELNRAVRNP